MHVTFSYVNLSPHAARNGEPPVLERRTKNRPALLIADVHAPHAIECALFERAAGIDVPETPTSNLPAGTLPKDADHGRSTDAIAAPPVFASMGATAASSSGSAPKRCPTPLKACSRRCRTWIPEPLHRHLWYCDVQIDAGPAYFLFVRLALARYQSDSIAGQHLSPVVMPDSAQLVAERTAAVTRTSTSLARVTIRGPAG